MKIVLIIVLVIILAAAGVLVFMFWKLKSAVLDGDGMINDVLLSCEYSVFGGMENDSLTMNMTYGDDNVSLVVCEGGDDEEKYEYYTLPDSAVDEIREIYNNYGIADWNYLPDSEYIAYDAPTTRISIETTLKTVTFDSNKEFPGDGYKAINEIYAVLAKYRSPEYAAENSTGE